MTFLASFDDRELAFMVLENRDHDYDAQLRAIRELLSLHRRDSIRYGEGIQEAEDFAKTASGAHADRAVDETIDLLHHSVYRDAAHSMAAVGMLAPFLESLFLHAFLGIGEHFKARSLPSPQHPRWTLKAKDQWDCHIDAAGGTNIVRGISDIARAIGLAAELPADLEVTLTALFRYRNAMFHEGFEWKSARRTMFAKAAAAWPAVWFSQATNGGDPWVFYMTDAFVDHVLATVEQTLEGIGRYMRPRL